jgi:DNA-binding beta-propeller fold protein YncE
LKAQNNNTPNAIVSRSLVSPRRLAGALLGDPANIVLSPDQTTAYVMNHHGSIVNAEFLQHGGRANISIMDVRTMVKREFDDTDAAVVKIVDGGWFGGVGLLVLPDVIIASASEGWLGQDGSNRISIIDKKTGGLVGQIEMALVGPGTRQLNTACAAFPVPFVSPTPPPVTYSFLGPSHAFGCWPNPQSLALGKGSDGRTYLISGNGGTEDVAVMDLQKALSGVPVVEVAPRIPVEAGPFGIAASPDGKFIAVTARQITEPVSRAARSPSSMSISRAKVSRARKPHVCRSGRMATDNERGRSGLPGRRMEGRSSSPTPAQTTCRS